MEEIAANLTREEVLELSKECTLEPMRNRLIITVNTADVDELDLDGAGLDEFQYVLARGAHVYENIKVGSRVQLDLDKMSTQVGPEEFQININPVKVGDRVYAYVYDSNIKAIDNQ